MAALVGLAAVALRIGSDELISYDAELTEAATRAGLSVLAPTGGRS